MAMNKCSNVQMFKCSPRNTDQARPPTPHNPTHLVTKDGGASRFFIMDYSTIEQINAVSFLSSLDDVKLLNTERNIDILCVSEKWLLTSIPDVFVEICMYKIFRCDNGRGADECIYVKNV